MNPTTEIAPAMIAFDLRALRAQRDLISKYAAMAAAWRADGGMACAHAFARQVISSQRFNARLTVKSLRHWLSIAE